MNTDHTHFFRRGVNLKVSTNQFSFFGVGNKNYRVETQRDPQELAEQIEAKALRKLNYFLLHPSRSNPVGLFLQLKKFTLGDQVYRSNCHWAVSSIVEYCIDIAGVVGA